MIERALTGDRRYWGWVVALLAVITVGSLFYLRQLSGKATRIREKKTRVVVPETVTPDAPE